MGNDYRHSQTERRPDDREAPNRARGPNRDTHRDASRNGSSSATLPSKSSAERSRKGALSPRDLTSAPKNDLFPEMVASKTAPDAKPTPRTAAAAQPDTADVQAKLQEFYKIDTDLRELRARRAKANKERSIVQSSVSRLSRIRTDQPPTMLNHLHSQQKKLEEELNTLDGQIRKKEARHFSVFQQLFQPFVVPGTSSSKGSPPQDCNAVEAALVAKMASYKASVQKTLLDHKSAMDQHLSATLSQYKSQMESLACRAQRDMQAMADKYEARISELTHSLEKESERNTSLQNQLLAHGQKLQELDHARSQPPRNCALAESVESNLCRLKDSHAEADSRTGALDLRINDLDLAVSQLRQTTVAELESTRKDTAEDVRKLSQEVASSRTEISSLPLDELKNLPAEFTNLQKSVLDRLDHQTGQPEVPQVSSGRPAQLQSPAGSSRETPDLHSRMIKAYNEVVADLERRKQSMQAGVGAIGKWIDDEREKRKNMGQGLEMQLSDLHAHVEGMKAEQTKLAEEMVNLKAQVDDLSQRGERLERIDEQFKSESCVIHAQLQSLVSWQENFNTKALYRDIVTHINSVTSDGVPKAIANLHSRLSAIERQVQASTEMVKRRRDSEDDDPSKRRRIGDNSTILRPASGISPQPQRNSLPFLWPPSSSS